MKSDSNSCSTSPSNSKIKSKSDSPSPSMGYTGTVGDRLLARIQRNVRGDITLPRNNTVLTAQNINTNDINNNNNNNDHDTNNSMNSPVLRRKRSRERERESPDSLGGYVSQEDRVRRSCRLRQTDTSRSLRQTDTSDTNKMKIDHRVRQTDTPETKRIIIDLSSPEMLPAVNSRSLRTSVLDNVTKNVEKESGISGEPDPRSAGHVKMYARNDQTERIRFRYTSDTFESEEETDKSNEKEKEKEDEGQHSDRLSVEVAVWGGQTSVDLGPDPGPKSGSSEKSPLSMDGEMRRRPDSGEYLCPDSDNTYATESLTSGQWLEEMTVAVRGQGRSGLGHHINFRTLRTEVSGVEYCGMW